MSHLNPGLISAYNSLTDKHLSGYFSNTRIRRHLQRAGLITRSGRIVPDKEYRHKLTQRAHQRHVRECLAQAIFHKVLEMERLHQIEIKKKLEEFARREIVHKIKVERSRRYEEDIIRILSPRPPTGARGIRKQHSGPECNSESSESPGSSRPNTAPGKMQRPVRLKPIHSNSTTASLRHSSPYRHHESSNENDPPFNCTMDKECRRRLTTMEASHGISPYCLPVINNFVTPVPPATKRKERGAKVTQSSTLRGRRLRPTTASSGADMTEDHPMLRSSVHQSRVCVNMVYFGKTVHLSNDLTDLRDEVKVFQQHCGGENLCVYKGKLREGESFRFVSRRHRGFPFSLTFFLNGLQVERLSSCCEFKHRKGSRLGGRHGHFGFSSVDGASPCYKCIIAMGLDKKPTPPPKRVKEEEGREESFTSPKDAPEMEAERTGGDTASDYERSQQQDMETQAEKETAAEEGKVRDDYEEDFEADDEGPAEEDKEKKSLSPTDEQTETQVKERDRSDTEDDERDEDIKSRSGSSCSGSDREASDAEATKDSREDEKREQPGEVDQEESLAPPEEKDEPKPEEAAAATEAESAVANDSELQDSAGDSTEIDISDSSVPSGTENKQSDDTLGDKKAEKTVDECKEKEGQEQERAKSVQERLAEAMLTESHFTSEPELSDTTTEEEEEVTDKGHKQSNNDVAPQELLTATEEEQTVREAEAEAEAVQDLEETSEPREQEDETEKEPDENSTKDEMVKIDEDDENCEEEATEKEKSEDTGADLHPVSEENMTEDNKTSEPKDGAAAEPTKADAAQKDEDNGESTAVDEVQPDEMGQGAKSSEEGESSVSELDKKTDETAVSDNAEAEEAMTASETMEMKAEPSEEQEALSCEEAPVADTEERKQGDGKDRTEASETEVTAENSADISEKSADISEDNVKDEGNKDDIKEEEAEEVLATEASKDADQQEKIEEEQTENPVELDEEVEKEKSEEESKQEEKQTNSDETPDGEKREEGENNETVKREEEENDENKTEERIENEEIIAEDTKTDSNTAGETNEEPAEKTLDIEGKVENEERANESEKTEKDKEREFEENKNDEEEPGAKGAINDKTDEGEEIKETKTDADEEKGDDTEKDENKAEQCESEKNKDDEESEEKEVACETGEETSANTEEPEKNADVKISNENTTESQDVGDNEAADETKTREKMLNNLMESEDVQKETEGAITDSEKEEIDAESGEISARAESKTHIDEPEASAEDNNDVKAAEHVEDERKMEEEPTEDESTEVKEVAVKSGDDKVDQGPDTDVVESEHKEGEDVFEKQEESNQKDSEQETAVTETEEHEETKNENGNKSDLDTENRDSDSTKDKDDNVHVALVASSAVEAQSTPIDFGLDDTSHVLNESSAMSDKHPQSDENVAAADLSAADGENGADMEEASKASEEGASVLLKPQAQNNETDEAEESIALGKQTPEALAPEDSADLVTNWVTMHQTSKFFQTFVEPLEDLKEEASHTQESVSSKEATTSTELPRSESPPKMVKMSESEEEEPMQKDESETRGENKVGAVESDIESEQAENAGSHENGPTKDTVHEKEETVVQELIPKAKTEDNEKESTNRQRKGSRVSLEDELQEGPTLTQTEIYKTEVDSIAGTNYSVASGKPESVKEKQTTDNGPDLNGKQTEAEEIIDLIPLSKMEEHGERSASPDGLRDGEETQGKTNEQSGEVTEITDFTTSKSDDGSQEEPHNGEIQPKPSDGSINGEKRDVQLIQDIKHTLSKDRLSTFSVDETLFGRSSYPLLTAAKTESGH